MEQTDTEPAVRFTILVVEDDKKVSRILESKLTEQDQFTVYHTNRISSARTILRNHHIDLLIQDISLPDGNGLQFCQEVKTHKEHSRIKVIILTKQTTIIDRIESFKRGADDYLPKPFFPEEIVIRTKLLLGLPLRKDDTTSTELKYKQFRLDFKHQFLLHRNTTVRLTRNETLILAWLFRNPNGTTNKKLLDYMHEQKGKRIDYNALRVGIKRLRDKLHKEVGMGMIKNRHGVGYYLGV